MMMRQRICILISFFVLETKGVAMVLGVEHKQQHDFSLNVLRRKDLVNAIKQAHPERVGKIVLFAGFEQGPLSFRQESSFYYFTGITEPGVVVVVDLETNAILYIPNCGQERSQWMFSPVALTQENAKNFGMQGVKKLGSACAGYQFHPYFAQAEYEDLLSVLQGMVTAKQSIFTLCPNSAYEYAEQRLLLGRLESFLPGLSQSLVDISPLVAQQRRTKDMRGIELMYTAAEITMLAQESAARAIGDGVLECEVQASLEYIFTAAGARQAFASIVGSGKNSTVLHYTINSGTMKNGDVVVVDIGAEYEYYAADIKQETRHRRGLFPGQR